MKTISKILLALGGGAAVASAGAFTYFKVKENDGEPAPPTSAPPPTGSSGITLSSDEIEALSRVIASETGSGTQAEQKSVGWTVRNRFYGKSIYAKQYPWRSQKGSDPPFASARPASESHRQLARKILVADQSEDPTGGATSFFEPRMQDVFAKAGALARVGETGNRVIDGVPLTDITRFKNYKKDAAQIRAKWSRGSTLYATAGRFEFWGRAKLFTRRGGVVQTVVGDAVGEVVLANDFEIVEGYTSTDHEALARMISSECGTKPSNVQHAAAWATRNRATMLGISIRDLLVPLGHYGPQGLAGGRGFASTRQKATEKTRAIASEVLKTTVEGDPTDGAIDFWEPSKQDEYIERGIPGYTKSAAEIHADHKREKLHIIKTIGSIELLGYRKRT